MAKAKKTEASAAAPKAGSGTSAPKPMAKKKSAAKTATPTASTPLIDTGLAAEAAAKLVVAKHPAASNTGDAQSPGGAKPSASFQQLKDSLNKPASSAMASFLDKAGGPGGKKSGVPFGGGKQVGRNQTFGADVNRTGVPRRTGG